MDASLIEDLKAEGLFFAAGALASQLKNPRAYGCQLTGKPFNGVMYDADLPRFGWGNYCEDAFARYGGRLGTGRGQKYKLLADGRWLKTGG